MSELVLGIESSCDETAAAVVEGGRRVLSSIVRSQIGEHAPFGGVVPEIAGRSHLDWILPVVDEALGGAGAALEDVGAIAVTVRPGLIGSLLVGLSAAKGLAYGAGLPLVGVHHIEAHAYAATMERADVEYPCLALVVSGGHTALYRVDGPAALTPLSQTLDDAAGEAFDKVASLLGLGYPGGPSIAGLAEEGDPRAVAFPRYRPPAERPAFSFSGLKTAVLYHLRGGDALRPTPPPEEIADAADVAASFQEAVADVLCNETLRALEREGLDTVLVAGGVACNRRLRELMLQRTGERGARAVFPSPQFCTDNAAMIAGLGYALWRAGAELSWDADAAPC